jgi:hypothetical protein
MNNSSGENVHSGDRPGLPGARVCHHVSSCHQKSIQARTTAENLNFHITAAAEDVMHTVASFFQMIGQ